MDKWQNNLIMKINRTRLKLLTLAVDLNQQQKIYLK